MPINFHIGSPFVFFSAPDTASLKVCKSTLLSRAEMTSSLLASSVTSLRSFDHVFFSFIQLIITLWGFFFSCPMCRTLWPRHPNN